MWLAEPISEPNPASDKEYYTGRHLRLTQMTIPSYHREPMAPRGRPALTEDVLRERTAAYCSRYGVKEFNDAGLPAYPAGKRESRQHRDWVNLFKAWSRFRRRTAAPRDGDRAAAVRAQKGQCPICLEKLSLTKATEAPPAADGRTPLVHPSCNGVLRFVAKAGPTVIDRVNAYLWPAASPAAADRRRRTRTD
jgi:hypothetical protein